MTDWVENRASSELPVLPPVDLPKPGSDAAIKAGCMCPVLDNAHGIGYMGVPGNWVYTMGCPFHDPEETSPKESLSAEELLEMDPWKNEPIEKRIAAGQKLRRKLEKRKETK